MKQHMFQPLLWFLLLLFAAARCFAEQSSNNLEEHIITFSPDIYVSSDYQPCLGVQVNAEILLTSTECTRAITAQLNNGVTIEALNSSRLPIGQIRQLSRMESDKGFLGLYSRKEGHKVGQAYPAFHSDPLASLKYAKGFHLPLTESGTQAVPVIIIHHKSDDHHRYLLKTSVSLPPGAPVGRQGKIVCLVASDGTCRAPVINKSTLVSLQESCSQCMAEEQQMYNTCSQICQSTISYQACKACSRGVQEKENECQQICGGLHDLSSGLSGISKPEFNSSIQAKSSIMCGGSMQGDLCNNDCAPHLMCSGFWQTAAQCMASQCDGVNNCVILGEDAASCNGLCQLRYRNGHIERGSYCH